MTLRDGKHEKKHKYWWISYKNFTCSVFFSRSRWPCGLRRRSVNAWLLGLGVRILLSSWMFVSSALWDPKCCKHLVSHICCKHLGGVIALAISIALLFIIPTNKSKFRGTQFYPINQVLFWTITNTVILLTWIGARPVEDPYILKGQILTTLYFIYYIVNPIITKLWDKITD